MSQSSLRILDLTLGNLPNTLNLYKQGATTNGATPVGVGATVNIPVVGFGQIVLGDTIQVATGPYVLTVLSLDTATGPPTTYSISAHNSTGLSFNILSGTRLIPTTHLPAMSGDILGLTSTNVISADPQSGRAVAYVKNPGPYDYILTPTGIAKQVITDYYPTASPAIGGTCLNVRDFPSIQQAIDNCPVGGRVYFPTGVYHAPAGGLIINKRIELFGDGPGNAISQGTIIRPPVSGASVSLNDHVIVLQPGQSDNYFLGAHSVYIHDLAIFGGSGWSTDNLVPYTVTGITGGTGDGIHAYVPNTTQPAPPDPPLPVWQINLLTLERVVVQFMNDGIHLEGNSNGTLVDLRLTNCLCNANVNRGFFLSQCNASQLINCRAANNGKEGIRFQGGTPRLINCDGEGNQVLGTNPNTDASFYFDQSGPVNIIGCHLESFFNWHYPLGGGTLIKISTAIILSGCSGGHIEGNLFTNGIPTFNPPSTPGKNVYFVGSRSIYLTASSRDNAILSNSHTDINFPVHISDLAGEANSGNFVAGQNISDYSTVPGGDHVVVPDQIVDLQSPTPRSGGNLVLVGPGYPQDVDPTTGLHTTGIPVTEPTLAIQLPALATNTFSNTQVGWKRGSLGYDAGRAALRIHDGTIFRTQSLTWLNAQDFDSIQHAIDALPGGIGTVYIPQGTYQLTAPLLIPFGGSLRLVGDGINRTFLHATSPDIDMIVIKSSYATLQGLHLMGAGTSGSGRGIVIGDTAGPGRVLANAIIEECYVTDTPSWALYIVGATPDVPDRSLLQSQFLRSHFVGAIADGAAYIGATNTTLAFRECNFAMAQSEGHYNDGVLMKCDRGVTGLIFDGCIFESAGNAHPWVQFGDCICVSFRTCWFEDGQSFTNPIWFIEFGGDTHGVQIDSSNFRRGTGSICHALHFLGQIHSATVSACEFFSGDGMSPTHGDEDIYVEPPGTDAKQSEVMVIGGWRATNNPSGPVRIFDANGGAGSMCAYKMHIPRTNGTGMLTNVVDGDMIVDVSQDPPVLLLYLNGGWRVVSVPTGP